MDLGSLFGGPAPAGPQPAALCAGPAPGAAKAPDATGAEGFGSLVDLALEQLAGDGECSAPARGSAGTSSVEPGDDADVDDASGDASTDESIDAIGLSVLIAMATPVAVPQAEITVPPPSSTPDGQAAAVVAADRPMEIQPAIDGGTAVAPVATDAGFDDALADVAAEDGTAAADAVTVAAARPETAATTQRGAATAAPPPARGHATARGVQAQQPAVDALAPALAPATSQPAGSAAPASSGAAVTAPATPAAPAASEGAGRVDTPARGPAVMAATFADARLETAGAQAGSGDASADASTGERFAPAATVARTAAAGRALEAALAGEAGGPASAAGTAPVGLAPVTADVQPLRAFDAPVPPVRFEHTLATVDPDTRNLQAMVRTVRLFTDGTGMGEARLQLEPDHLGPVALTVRVEQGSVSAHFRAETPAAQRWIETHQQELRAGLREQGLEVKEVVVTTDPDGRRERQADQQPRRARMRRADADAPRFEVVV